MQMEKHEKGAKREIELDQERLEADNVAAKHLETKLSKQQQKVE